MMERIERVKTPEEDALAARVNKLLCTCPAPGRNPTLLACMHELGCPASRSVVVERLKAELAPTPPAADIAPDRKRQEHRLVDGTLQCEPASKWHSGGIIGRCICGWTTGHRFSSFAASAAFMDHQEKPND